jgi:hypothetical protein
MGGRPKATIVIPGQAEAEVRAKAAPRVRKFENCFELIAKSARNMAETKLHDAWRTLIFRLSVTFGSVSIS